MTTKTVKLAFTRARQARVQHNAAIDALHAENQKLKDMLITLISLQEGLDSAGDGITEQDWNDAKALVNYVAE